MTPEIYFISSSLRPTEEGKQIQLLTCSIAFVISIASKRFKYSCSWHNFHIGLASIPLSLSLFKVPSLLPFKTLKIFKWIKKNGISDKEMLQTFNCGVGFCLIINPRNYKKIARYFTREFKPYIIGKITRGKDKVKLNGSINWI